MIDEEIQNERDNILQKIDHSKIISTEKKYIYRKLLIKAAEATNGVSEKEKLQSCCENQFGLISLYILHNLDFEKNLKNTKFSIFANVIEKCKWQLTIISFFFAILLIYHPEIVNVFKSFFTN